MKRINIFFCVIASILVLSCSKPTLEERAKSRVKNATELYVSDPNSLIIQDIQVKISNDSLCVLQYLAKSKNSVGGYETDEMEYILVSKADSALKKDLNSWYEFAHSIKGENESQSVTEVRSTRKMLEDYLSEGVFPEKDIEQYEAILKDNNNISWFMSALWAFNPKARKVNFD